MRGFLSILTACICAICTNTPAKDLEVDPGKYNVDISKFDFIDTTLNVIQFPSGNKKFEPFFNKLDTLVFENRGQVKILHIGGSHIQADVSSGRIREHLVKEYPGASAGRGFVFPYSAARTNTPSSYGSSYRGIWTMNKNVQHEINLPLGLLGIAVSTNDPRAEITLLLNKYNSEPIWQETKFRLFGYSDSNDVVPVLRVDNMDIQGELDKASQSYVFTSPRPIDTIQIAFRWNDRAMQDSISKFVVDSLVQDSIIRAEIERIEAEMADSSEVTPSDSDNNSERILAQAVAATLPPKPIPPAGDAARDSMFQGNCDILDSACLNAQNGQAVNPLYANVPQPLYSAPGPARPRFTLTGILSETNNPGISYTNVGINGARVADYFEQDCPLFEKEMQFFKPDLVIFAIGINDANVEVFNDKLFRDDYELLISRILKVSPKTAFIFETNNDSFRKVRKTYVQHPNGEIARKSFFTLAEKYGAGVWDKFSIMGGLGSMEKWEKANLAKKDKVHFKMAGYNLLGDMFYKAFINAYQEHIANLPAITPTNKN